MVRLIKQFKVVSRKFTIDAHINRLTHCYKGISPAELERRINPPSGEKVCQKGHTVKYANGQCVECAKEKTNRYRQRRAEGVPRVVHTKTDHENEKYYYGGTCPRGHNVRYKSNGLCVACHKNREAARYAAKKSMWTS